MFCIKFLEVKSFTPWLETSKVVSKAAFSKSTLFPAASNNLGTICKAFGPKTLSTETSLIVICKEFAAISFTSVSDGMIFWKIFISPNEGGAVLAQLMPFSCATLSAIAKISGTFFPSRSLPRAFSSSISPSASTPKVFRI